MLPEIYRYFYPLPLVYLCLVSLYRFMCLSERDVAALAQMLGPDLAKFKGTSARIDSTLEQLLPKMNAANARAQAKAQSLAAAAADDDY